jgi:hypothetical protein
MPPIAKVRIGTATPDPMGTCASEYSEAGGASPTIPTKQGMPNQHGKIIPAHHYFPAAKTKTDRVPARSGRNTATTKSAANALIHGKAAPAKTRKGR